MNNIPLFELEYTPVPTPEVDLVTSISYDSDELISGILSLHVPNRIIDCDPTYSTGIFYSGKIPAPKYRFDINPQTSDVVQADCRELPLSDNSIGCLMFDPPFLATKGKSLSEDKGNIINKRFSVYPTESALHKFYVDAMREFYRVLKPDGILIFKCQDKVSSSKQYMTHCFIYNEAIKLGYYPKDLFILLAKNRIVADWQRVNQQNARKYHSYFWVFQKCDTVIKYTE